ncbi:hypothetical protein LSTR_LSTR015792 [Laodelphax striatellus]|uniref:Uncharacterized protein n=1 Tax=Laodelphax striatellus TaxID=195883 RepID=A0A482X7D8_LAOST|nr:hypothetical protein LSTR_LSTR015792 [Laodelphax striatellus]
MDDSVGMAVLFVDTVHTADVLGGAGAVPLPGAAGRVPGALLQRHVAHLHRAGVAGCRAVHVCRRRRGIQLLRGR